MVGDWKGWYVRRDGGYWATVKTVDNTPIQSTAYATYHWDELLHYINGVVLGYDNSPTPSLLPPLDIEIP